MILLAAVDGKEMATWVLPHTDTWALHSAVPGQRLHDAFGGPEYLLFGLS